LFPVALKIEIIFSPFFVLFCFIRERREIRFILKRIYSIAQMNVTKRSMHARGAGGEEPITGNFIIRLLHIAIATHYAGGAGIGWDAAAQALMQLHTRMTQTRTSET
jgi:hypothetical protein